MSGNGFPCPSIPLQGDLTDGFDGPQIQVHDLRVQRGGQRAYERLLDALQTCTAAARGAPAGITRRRDTQTAHLKQNINYYFINNSFIFNIHCIEDYLFCCLVTITARGRYAALGICPWPCSSCGC